MKRVFRYIHEKRQFVYDYIDFFSALVSISASVIGISFLIWGTSPDKNITVCVVTLTFLVLCITWLAVRLSNKHGSLSNELHDMDSTISTLGEKNESLESKIRILRGKEDQISAALHNIYHESRDLYYSFHVLSTKKQPIDDEEKKRIDIQFVQFIASFLDNCRHIFNLISETSNCAVTIKTLDSKNGVVTTYARDSVSKRSRHKTDINLQSFNVKENTAFLVIFSGDYPDDNFVCDDLKNNGAYNNINPNWKNLYNASVVVPIRVLYGDDNTGSQRYDVFGFLCVDNLEGGLEKEAVVEIASALSDNLYCLLSRYALI